MYRIAALVLGLPILAGAAFLAYALSPPELEAVPTPERAAFAQSAIERGQRVALLGNCNVCHTAEGGPAYAGGYGVETPFGTIHGTNITPDRQTGIGAWSEAAFARAMREGLDRRGEHLYPAFPYDHFTKLSDGDVADLYAFLMTREPVRRENRPNELPALLQFRPFLAAWKLVGLREGRFEPDRGADARLEYGRYLVEGAGHCGACHTPRNLLQAERRGEALQGGMSAGWSAPAIAGPIRVAVPWTQASLETYLTDGFDADHGAGAGPMQPVGANLARTPREDAAAIAAYLLSVMRQETRAPPPEPAPEVEARTRTMPGAALFRGACLSCHGGPASGAARGIPLDRSDTTHAQTPRNLVNFILHGRQPAPGTAGPAMPGFANTLTRAQIADIAAYVRARYSAEPPFARLAETVDELAERAGAPGGSGSP